MLIIPTTTSNDQSLLKKQLELLSQSEIVDTIQIDIIDGQYADNLTDFPENLAKYSDRFTIEAHLMVTQPFDWIDKCLHAGIHRVITQLEPLDDQLEFIDAVLEKDMEVGLAVDGMTPIDAIEHQVWRWLDTLIIFGGQAAGKTGQTFQPSALTKISRADNIRQVGGYPFTLQVDGGVNLETIKAISATGADAVAANTAVYANDAIQKNIMKLIETAG